MHSSNTSGNTVHHIVAKIALSFSLQYILYGNFVDAIIKIHKNKIPRIKSYIAIGETS